MTGTLDQHAAWLAKSLGRTDDLPMRPDDARALSDAGTIVDKHRGTHLFKEGTSADSCYLIISGEVDLYRTGGSGRLMVGRLGPGSVVGDIAMFQQQPYLSSAKARTNVRAIRLERTTLIPLLLTRPVLSMRWLVNGLTQLEATQRRIIRLMNRTVVEQVAGVLLDEQDAYGEIALSQAALAELLGASRQAVNEALAHLRELGAIETGYRRVRVIDHGTLEAISAG
jgi:CRP-like cAMP-binding protein